MSDLTGVDIGVIGKERERERARERESEGARVQESEKLAFGDRGGHFWRREFKIGGRGGREGSVSVSPT